MHSSKKSKETISISLGSILGIVVSIALVPFSIYLVHREEQRYVKPVVSPDVKGIEIDTTEDSASPELPEVAEEVTFVGNTEEYFVRMNFNGIYRTISHEDFSTLITDGALDKEKFDNYLNKKIAPYFDAIFGEKVLVKNRNGQFYTRKGDVAPDFSTLYEKINNGYINGIKDIRIDIDGGDMPGTDGKYAEKYMEVDNSQQKLYVWKNGVVEKVIGLSGPVYGFQVYGVFPIVDKGREPIAPGGKYMPYWMAFYYSRKQDSWYGLHGLIWMYREDGSKWFEPESNIYTRQSAGCIRMVVSDAKYLYENFQKGDLLLIHE